MVKMVNFLLCIFTITHIHTLQCTQTLLDSNPQSFRFSRAEWDLRICIF